MEGYAANPSDLTALAYLELALLEKELGRTSEYRRQINKGVSELNLSEMDFRGDVDFRRHLHENLNSARPETCLLFLAAEEARTAGRADEARKHYTTLVERAPGSPFAWEGLAKMSVMPDADPKEVDRLAQILLQTYPLIWGCPRPRLKLDRDAFAAQLPALLRKAGREAAKDAAGALGDSH